jgi:hypothetical protein
MSACSNCGIKLGCSCQRRTASDGTSVCSSCVIAYEEKLKTNAQQKESIQQNANIWGNNRYNNLQKFVK